MNTHKLKFTLLQQEIINLLSIKTGTKLNQRRISILLKVSPTAVSKSLIKLKNHKIIQLEKDKFSKILSISLNFENPKVQYLKRIENIKMIYESELAEFLYESFPGSRIILFGSYSRGEDTITSDVDIAIVKSKEKNINLIKYEEMLERKINLNFYKDLNKLDINLKANIERGIDL
ncbi:nucleotidyltransferase domain-containing protein [archaeon]|jgi:predicted nucleotidyltransferase|nr:nucleotidyltransferase domain-containing protein [archaeon]MBT4351457.1 nucleotidyltransferase domain-containing protein [archaeon]MBT4647741.1 nucleotidyltransferase domain-containing protein [archaeon]MBT6821269.1 nucleotidyltransferase domain-containing protein [archaeon]MBT7392054.1 nucleotidyltransferase domain-containing protein [archaeon]